MALDKPVDPFSLQRRLAGGGTPLLSQWGFRNETDRLTDVLLGSPAHLFHRATSSLSRKHLREAPCNIQVAQAQHAELVDAYRHFNVDVHFLEAEPELTMQVYARDSSVMTPYGAFITAMSQWWRRGENYRAIETYQKLGIPIYDYVTAGTFEGGDFNIIEPGRVLIGYCGERSEKEGSEQVADFVRAEGWEAVVAPISREFVHMDGLIVPLAEKLVVACVDAMEPWLVDVIRGWGVEIVDVEYREAKNLGVNLVALGDGKVLSMAGATDLNAKMRALGFEVYDPDMSMFTLGGGGVHCLCQALRREEA
mgnify:CR=1 FL=1